MLRKRGAWVAIALALIGVGCGSSGAAPPSTGPVARFKLSGTTVPNFLDVPFPSDVYLQNGTILDPIPGFDTVFTSGSQYLTHELGKMDGFSRVALSLFYVDDTTKPLDKTGNYPFAPIDPTTLPATEDACIADTSQVFLLDLAVTDPTMARVRCRAEYHDDSALLSTTHPVLAVGPGRGIVLAEGHAYAAVVTSRVKDVAGKNLLASADFQAVLGASASGATGPSEVYAGALAKVSAALASALATDGAKIVSVAPYTTNTLTQELFKMREALATATAPTLAWDSASMAPMGATKFAAPVAGALPAGFTATLDAWLGVVAPTATLPDGSDDPDSDLPVRAHDKIAAIGTAVFKATNYLSSLPGSYSQLDDATFTHDSSGNVIPDPTTPTVPIWVSFAIPTAPMPAAGYPVVIVQHGLGGSRSEEFMEIANTLANQGWIAAAIDSVTFGARAPEVYYQVDQISLWQEAPGATYTGPDGFADPVDATTHKPSLSGSTNGSNDLFGNLEAIGALRDQFRQSEFDTAQLLQLLRSNPDLSPLQTGATAPAIDPTRVAYLGDSLGAIEGAVAAAIEPNCSLWVLNVGGGGLLNELAAHAPAIGATLELAAGLNFGFLNDTFTESHPLNAIIQTVADPGDPLNYAPYLITAPGMINTTKIAPRNIVQIEVVYDELVSNEADEALARAGGYGFADPNVGSNSGIDTLALVRDPSNNPQAVPLPSAMPDSMGLIHDTPQMGITAVVVQTSPSQHGDDLFASLGHRSYAIPYTQPFTALPTNQQFDVHTSYRQLQTMVNGFLTSGFAGTTPTVSGFLPPVRDFDDDGMPDSTNPNPNNPDNGVP
jgi:hypothetical protein